MHKRNTLKPLKTLNKQQIKQLLETRFKSDTIDSLAKLPSPFELKDMSKASDRIAKAILNKEKILLVSDYDVDGTTSRVIIESFFKHINADISSITPNRFKDGYGLTLPLIKGTDAKVIITLDNGISSYEAGEYCFNNGIDLIITDHHIATKLPKAYAIVNPKQPNCPFSFKEICGAQIAWYLVGALKSKLDIKYDMNNLLDILVLAIVADVMPLVSINRVLVKQGLKCFSQSQKPAMLAIKEKLKKNLITAEDIAFGIAPKINVASRLEDASLAIAFLQSNDIFEAREAYEYLEELNNKRKQMQEDIVLKSYEMCENDKTQKWVMVVADDSFHSGIIGIVASKLTQKFKKIALVGYIDKSTSIVKISGRSFGGIDLHKLLAKCSQSLISFGGHKEAVGLNIKLENLEAFTEQINEEFEKTCEFKEIDSTFGILDIKNVDYELIEILESFEPFGHKNEKPIFLLENIKVQTAQNLGQDKKTLKLILDTPNMQITAIEFRSKRFANELEGKTISLKASVGVNIFRGERTLQLMIQDILA